MPHLLVGRAYKALRPKRCYCGWVPIYVSIYLPIVCHLYFLSRHRVATSFSQFLSRPLCNCLVKKIKQDADVFTHKHTQLPASSFSIMCSQARITRLIILTGSNNNKIKIAEYGQLAVGTRHPPPTPSTANILLLLPKMLTSIDCLYGEGGGV